MHAIQDDRFSAALRALAEQIPRPVAVLVVSAHWLTPGETLVLASRKPRTIHDFWGFPPELYAVEYAADGSPLVASAVSELIGARPDTEWGLDHASWSVLRHMWPDADVPVLELSLDIMAEPLEHVALARALAPLRDRGVLVVGSGNVVHNLRAIDWRNEDGGSERCREFDAWVAEKVADGDVEALADYLSLGELARYAAPTSEHYLPLLYAAALREDGEAVSFPYEGLEYGSLSMRCVRVG